MSIYDAYCQAQIWVNSVGIGTAEWRVTDPNGIPIYDGNKQFPPNQWVLITSDVWRLLGAPSLRVSVILNNNNGQPALFRLDDFSIHCWAQ
ncbi:hypothetical protein [Actinomadura oligospora]|uniref:hypothetical protein n=1 Tax=Actinomadura oligospora TaxID=111804 RepID=UPI00047DDBF1|nr:hypothetical protein [Actinomadura oligospora]